MNRLLHFVRGVDLLAGRGLACFVRLYQLSLGFWFGGRCRFYPSCSHYGYEALREHGAVRGLWLTVCRVGKCHPLHEGGVDPVPLRRVQKVSAR